MNDAIFMMQLVAVSLIAADDVELRTAADGEETSTDVPVDSVVVNDTEKPKPNESHGGIFTPVSAGVLGSGLSGFVGRPSGYPLKAPGNQLPYPAGYPGGYQTGVYPGGYQTGAYPGGYQTGAYPGGYQTGAYPGGYQTGAYPGGYQTGFYPGGHHTGGYSQRYPTGGYPYPYGANSAAYPAGDYPIGYPSVSYPVEYATGYPANPLPLRNRYPGYAYMRNGYHQQKPRPVSDIVIRTEKGDYIFSDPFTSRPSPIAVSPRQRFNYDVPYPDDGFFY